MAIPARLLPLELVDRFLGAAAVRIVLRRKLEELLEVLDREPVLLLRGVDRAEVEVVDRVPVVLADALDQESLGLVELLALYEEESELRDRLGIRRVEIDRLAIRVDRLLEALLEPIDLAVRVPEPRFVRRLLHCLGQRDLGVGLLALTIEEDAELEVRTAVVLVEVECFLEVLARLVELVLIAERHSEQNVCLGVVGRVLERGAKLE